MKYRGVKLIAIKEHVLNKRGDKTREVTVGYSIIGGCYPDTIEGVKKSVDELIPKVMAYCKVDEKTAVKLLNEN